MNTDEIHVVAATAAIVAKVLTGPNNGVDIN